MAKKTIMIVEDDPAISEMLSLNLTKEGYEVVTAISADEALKKIGGKGRRLLYHRYYVTGFNGWI